MKSRILVWACAAWLLFAPEAARAYASAALQDEASPQETEVQRTGFYLGPSTELVWNTLEEQVSDYLKPLFDATRLQDDFFLELWDGLYSVEPAHRLPD